MKTKPFNKKLMLKKETVVNLNAVAMKEIRAGYMPITYTCFVTATFDELCRYIYQQIEEVENTGSNLC